MLPPRILLGSQNEATIRICEETAAAIGVASTVKKKIEDLLLILQETDFRIIIFDLQLAGIETLKTIRLIRRMRPKIPLIVLTNKIDKTIGGKILNEGVFNIVLAPNKNNLFEVLNAILKIKS